MDSVHAFILGIIQGIGEFLPISSSAHLELYKYFFRIESAPLMFDVLLHMATLASICLIFRKRLKLLFVSFFRFIVRKNDDKDKENLSIILIILLSSLITAIVGFSIRDLVHNLDIKAISIGFIITALMLAISNTIRFKRKPNVLRSSAFLGIAQGLAVFPGISRLGMTLSVILILGFLEKDALELSFILSIPAVLGATILELVSSYKTLQDIGALQITLGMGVAFVTALIALPILSSIVRKGKTYIVSVYLILLSLGLGTYFMFFIK